MNLHVVSVFTDAGRLDRLDRSCGTFGVRLVAHRPRVWTGKCSKLAGVADAIRALPDGDVVVFVDAYDSAVCATPRQILDRFDAFRAGGARVVFQAERNCWPDDAARPAYALAYHGRDPGPWRFLNAGGYAGTVADLRAMLHGHPIHPREPDDQRHFTRLYLHETEPRITLDHGCELFQSLFESGDDVTYTVDGPAPLVTNNVTGSEPCVLHGNGSFPMDAVDRWLDAAAAANPEARRR